MTYEMPSFFWGFENFAGFSDPNAGVLHFGDGTPGNISKGSSIMVNCGHIVFSLSQSYSNNKTIVSNLALI
jgi:hypothetical protein